MGARIGSSCLIRSLLPAPPPASAEATWLLSLPPKMLATILSPSCWSTWSTLTPPSSRPLAAWVLAAVSSLLESMSSACDVVLQTADERGNQRPDRGVHLAFVDAELARNVLYRNLVEEFVETSHDLSTFVAGCARVATATLVAPILADRRSARRFRRAASVSSVTPAAGSRASSASPMRRRRGQHAAEVREGVAVERQRQPALPQQHRRRLVAGVALLRHRRAVASAARRRGVGLDRVMARSPWPSRSARCPASGAIRSSRPRGSLSKYRLPRPRTAAFAAVPIAAATGASDRRARRSCSPRSGTCGRTPSRARRCCAARFASWRAHHEGAGPDAVEFGGDVARRAATGCRTGGRTRVRRRGRWSACRGRSSPAAPRDPSTRCA